MKPWRVLLRAWMDSRSRWLVGGVEHHGVGVAEHHAGDHAALLLATGEHRGFLEHLLAREEHLAEEAFEVDFGGVVGELAEPVNEVHVGVEEGGVVQGEVGRGDGLPPLEGACVGLAVAHYDFKESRHGAGVAREEAYLVVLLHLEVEVAEEHFAVGC